MVLVRGSAATPNGCGPTAMVAVTLIRAAGADAADAAVLAANPRAAIATVIKVAARWVHLMASCFRASPAGGCSGSAAVEVISMYGYTGAGPEVRPPLPRVSSHARRGAVQPGPAYP